MPGMFIELDEDKLSIVVEPSFGISTAMEIKVAMLRPVIKMEVIAGRRLTVDYTRGYEIHETLAAIMFVLTRELPESGTFTISHKNEEQNDLFAVAIQIAELMHAWAGYSAKVMKEVALVAEIDKRIAGYEENVQAVKDSIKWTRDESGKGNSEWHATHLEELIARRRRIASNKRHDPGRRAKAQARLDALEAEIRKLRPTYRRLVRPELQKMVG